MAPTISSAMADVFRRVKNALGLIGYGPKLLREDYRYFEPTTDRVKTIQLAGFAQEPPSYRNACVGVALSNGHIGADNVAQHRALCAPLIFEIEPNRITQWKIPATGQPQPIARIGLHEIENAFTHHRADWSPRRIFEAKTSAIQLDFVDLGLMPIHAKQIHQKLDRLLRRTLDEIARVHEQATHEKLKDEELFRFVFRFVAAKVLRDREEPGDWNSDDPFTVLRAMEEYYGTGTKELPATNVTTPQTIEVAWKRISSAFHFQHLSVDDLAFVYENTLVDPLKRKAYGIHSTPPHIAEYITQKLPIHLLDRDKRRVLEPFSGHGVFLVSAMRRLRDELEADISSRERHEYFKERLIGLEFDSFAREVSRLSLMLADYPNPNGWQIHADDVFATKLLEEELPLADVVLSNPPFGRFSAEEQQRYKDIPTHLPKPVVALNRIMAHPPLQLGIVLPEVFTFGASYRQANRRIAESFENVEIVALPDRVFSHADQETVLLMAWNPKERNTSVTVTCRAISEKDYPAFRDEGKVPPSVTQVKAVPVKRSQPLFLWVPQFIEVWDFLSSFEKISTVADIKRGIEWKAGVDPNTVVSTSPIEGWERGYITTRSKLKQYYLGSPVYINPDATKMRFRPMEFNWSDPKIFINANASSRGPWRLSAVTEVSGALATQSFHIVFAKSAQVAPEVLTALFNGPVANAWAYDVGDKRHNKVRAIGAIPIPLISQIDQHLVVEKVARLEGLFGQAVYEQSTQLLAKKLVIQIDELILRAYGFPSELKHKILRFFADAPRPMPFEFTGYDDNYEQAIRELDDEQAQLQRIKRYQELGDLLYMEQLDEAGKQEMERLEQEIDSYDAPFYEKALENIRARGEQG
jgi:hypothetical protein